MQMRKFKVRMQRINHVFITHLHGDHYLGLMGFISSMHLLGRKAKLHVFGPAELWEIIQIQLKASSTFLVYEIEFHPVSMDEKQLVFEDKTIRAYSFPMKHRIPCCGYLFEEKERKPKIKKEEIDRYKLQPSQIIALKNGVDVTLENGQVVSADQVSIPAEALRSYAYCSDTAYSEKVMDAVRGVTTIYHESTFLDSEKERAKETFHSTAKQAATVAKNVGATKLILGHFSSRYTDDNEFLVEAKTQFDHAILADEGMIIHIE